MNKNFSSRPLSFRNCIVFAWWVFFVISGVLLLLLGLILNLNGFNGGNRNVEMNEVYKV